MKHTLTITVLGAGLLFAAIPVSRAAGQNQDPAEAGPKTTRLTIVDAEGGG